MAVIITDTRTIWSDCDTADWDGPESESLYTSAPAPKELSGCLGFVISEEANYATKTQTSIDISSSTLIYVWALTQGTIDNTTTGGIQIVLGDATPDMIGYHVGGSDVAGFRHDDGQVGWQCFVIDSTALPATYTEHAGTQAGLLLSAITDMGVGFSVASKSLGGTENCFVDNIRYGNAGLTITGGGSGTEGDFSEIATDDALNTDGKGYGICRQLAAGTVGLQGPLLFGDAGTGSVDFYATDETVVFEDRNLGTSKYYINVTGNATGTTSFQLGTQVGATTSGSNGVSLICPTGVGASFDASNAAIEDVYIYGSTFSGFNNGINFSADATNGITHEIYGNTFNACGQIDPGKTLFKNNSISGTTDSTTGAILLDEDGTANWTDLTFTSGGTGHGIYITATGTYTFTNFSYGGYGADDTTDAAVYNNSGGSVTINVTGGLSPTVRNGASASTTINNNKTLDIHVQDVGTNDIASAVVAVYDSSDDSELVNELTDSGGDITQASIASGTDIYVRIRKSTSGTRYYPVETVATVSDNLSLTITMTEDTTA